MSRLTSEEEAVMNALGHEGKEYQSYFFSKAKDLKWFQPLKERGYFEPSLNPPPQQNEKGLYSIPVWPALQYLEKISPELTKPENQGYAEEVLQLIRDVSKASLESNVDNCRTWGGFARILAKVPTNLILYSDIELVGVWLKSRFSTSLLGRELSQKILPNFLHSDDPADWRKAERLVELVTEVRIIEKVLGTEESFTVHEVHALLDDYSLKELFKRNAELLGKRAGLQVVEILTKQVRRGFTSETHDAFSYIWRKAVEEHQQNAGRDDAEHILISALRDVLCAFASEKPSEGRALISSLLANESLLIRRVALYAINKNFASCRDLLLQTIGPQWFQPVFQHELYCLLAERFAEMSIHEQAKVLEIISSLTTTHSDAKESDLPDKAMKLEWLHAIRGKGNEQADELYEDYFAVVQRVGKHPDFPSYVETRWGALPPMSKDQLLEMSIADIVSYSNNFQETGTWDGPTEEGLADVLRQAVYELPTKFDSEIALFLDAKLGYQVRVITGFEEAWNSKKHFDWKSVLTFCEKLVEQQKFWASGENQLDSNLKPRRSWLTSQICSLLSCGVRDDKWAFDEKLLPLAENIIRKVLENETPTANGDERDALTEALNTPKGRCIGSLIAYSLRRARLLDSKGADRNAFWANIQPVFDNELNRCVDGNYEFSALAGRDILQLHYLNAGWVKKRFNDIFSLNSERNWRCAMQGYSYVGLVHPEIYECLKKGGHLQKAIRTTWQNDEVRKRIIQQLAVLYVEGNEELTGDGLFSQVISSWKTEDICEIIWQFWTGRNQDLGKARRERIILFWKWCADRIRTHEANNNEDILSELTLLTCYLSEIGPDEKAMLIQAAPYTDRRHHSSFFMEYLDNLSGRSSKAVADVFRAMLTGTVPTFEEESVVSIVTNLYKGGLKAEANEIVNQYAMHGFEFLRPLYEKCNLRR